MFEAFIIAVGAWILYAIGDTLIEFYQFVRDWDFPKEFGDDLDEED